MDMVIAYHENQWGENYLKRDYKIGIGIGIAVILLIVSYLYYTFPQSINLTYEGIKYRLGTPQQQEQIKITLNGYYYKRLFIKDFFEGSIYIENENYPRLRLLVNEEQQMLSYRDDNGRLHTYGEAFIGENLGSLTICVQNVQEHGWTSGDGVMVSAPAKNRIEALEISKKLMNSKLKTKLDLK